MDNQEAKGISLDFTPDVEMLLALQTEFRENRSVTMDALINQLCVLIRLKAELQCNLLHLEAAK